MRYHHLGIAFLLSTAIRYAQAVLPFFVYNHHTLTRTRLDPIIQPGGVSAHTHVFAGSNHITANADFASISQGTCTTSPITIDKSLYWAPQLYYKDEAGKFHVMTGDGLVTYWFYHRSKDDAESYPELPDDFRMVAGDMKRDSLDMSRPADQAVSYQCFGPGYDFRLPYIPADFECETIRPQVGFPNCWNGVDSYKTDNSHVAYGEGNYEYGKCPEGFKRIPSLFLEAYYKPKAMLGEVYTWRPGSLVFAHGDNFGLTFHADWMNGFPKGALNEAYDACKAVFDGTVASCPYFQPYINPEESRNCDVTGQIVNEAVGIQTPLDHLPGNNVEYNSSALANKPKVVDPGYQETASLVDIVKENGGICKSQICTDYHGPKGGSGNSSHNTISVPAGLPTKTITSLISGPSGTGVKPAVSNTLGAGGPQVVIVTVYETVYVTGQPPVAPPPGAATTSVASPPGGATTSIAPPPGGPTTSAAVPGVPTVTSSGLPGAIPVVGPSGIIIEIPNTSRVAEAAIPSETGRCNRKRMAACP